MRIGYLVPEFPTQTHAFFWRELSALRELGHEVELYSTRRPPLDACVHEFAKEAREQTHYLFPPTLKSVLGLLRAIRSLPGAVSYLASLNASEPKERLKHLGLLVVASELAASCRDKGVDHLHLHSAADAAHLGALCKLLGGPRYSITLHGDLDVYGKDHVAKMSGAEFVSTVTRPLHRQVIERVHLDPSKVPVIWMGVDTGSFKPFAEGPPPETIEMITIARLNKQKGHVHALRGLRACVSRGLRVRYTIAGAGEYAEEIEAEISRLQLGDHVRMVGTVSQGQVKELLQASHVFILPSVGLGEAAPVSVMEAASCGCAIICSKIGGTTDMLRDGIDGILTEQGDEKAIEEAIVRLTTKSNDLKQFRLNARARALSLFDYKAMAARLLQALEGDPAGSSLM